MHAIYRALEIRARSEISDGKKGQELETITARGLQDELRLAEAQVASSNQRAVEVQAQCRSEMQALQAASQQDREAEQNLAAQEQELQSEWWVDPAAWDDERAELTPKLSDMQ